MDVWLWLLDLVKSLWGPLHTQAKGHDHEMVRPLPTIHRPYHRCSKSHFGYWWALKYSVKWKWTMLRDHCIFYWWEKRGNPISPVTCLHCLSFSLFFFIKFYIGEKGKEGMMDHLKRRGMILVALALYWYLHMIVQHVLDMQALALNGGWKNALI